MQWLIDIVTASVIAQIGIPPVFIDRGDPNDWDLTNLDMVMDNTWRTWDLSAIVPAGASAVSLNIRGRHFTPGKELAFAENGNINYHNSVGLRTMVGSLYIYTNSIVKIDSNRCIQYKAMAPNWQDIKVCVQGWFL